MKTLFLSFLCACLLLACQHSKDQSPTASSTTESEQSMSEKSYIGKSINRFEQAIRNMETEDSLRTPRENEVLFTGSSSIRLWKNLQLSMDPIPVINRGFGGSTIPEVMHYADRMIFPYQPELIVLYCGENDIADGASPDQVFAAFKELDQLIRNKLPDTELIYISKKPSPARWQYWEQYQDANEKFKNYLDSKTDRYFVDCSSVMLTPDGTPDTTIFVEDKLHMNEEGYQRWNTLIRPQVEALYRKQVIEEN